jgi:tRNA modification GTPase
MQQAARDAIERADLLLLLQGCDQAEPWRPPIELPEHVASVTLQTKVDLLESVSTSSASASDAAASRLPEPAVPLPISAATGRNLDRLKATIAERLGERAVSLSGDMLALQPRHEQAIRTAIDQLDAAIAQVTPQQHDRHIAGVEVVADQMRAALDALAALGGRMTPDDVLGKVFSTFCIGK